MTTPTENNENTLLEFFNKIVPKSPILRYAYPIIGAGVVVALLHRLLGADLRSDAIGIFLVVLSLPVVKLVEVMIRDTQLKKIRVWLAGLLLIVVFLAAIVCLVVFIYPLVKDYLPNVTANTDPRSWSNAAIRLLKAEASENPQERVHLYVIAMQPLILQSFGSDFGKTWGTITPHTNRIENMFAVAHAILDLKPKYVPPHLLNKQVVAIILDDFAESDWMNDGKHRTNVTMVRSKALALNGKLKAASETLAGLSASLAQDPAAAFDDTIWAGYLELAAFSRIHKDSAMEREALTKASSGCEKWAKSLNVSDWQSLFDQRKAVLYQGNGIFEEAVRVASANFAKGGEDRDMARIDQIAFNAANAGDVDSVNALRPMLSKTDEQRALSMLTVALANYGQIKEAEKIFSQLISPTWEERAAMGKAFARGGNNTKAVKMLDPNSELRPPPAKIAYLAGLGRIEEAFREGEAQNITRDDPLWDIMAEEGGFARGFQNDFYGLESWINKLPTYKAKIRAYSAVGTGVAMRQLGQ